MAVWLDLDIRILWNIPTSGFSQFVVVRRSSSLSGSACSPGLGLLGSPRLASASLALPARATTAAALHANWPLKAAGLLLRGAGKASEADPRRGKPSKPGLGPLFGSSVEAYICQWYKRYMAKCVLKVVLCFAVLVTAENTANSCFEACRLLAAANGPYIGSYKGANRGQ